MTAALVSEHRLGRLSSVLSPWRFAQARCTVYKENVFPSTLYQSISIFVSIDPYIPTGYEPGLSALPIRNLSIIEPADICTCLVTASHPCTLVF